MRIICSPLALRYFFFSPLYFLSYSLPPSLVSSRKPTMTDVSGNQPPHPFLHFSVCLLSPNQWTHLTLFHTFAPPFPAIGFCTNITMHAREVAFRVRLCSHRGQSSVSRAWVQESTRQRSTCMLQRPARHMTPGLCDRAIPCRADVGPGRKQGFFPHAFLFFLRCAYLAPEKLATSGDILPIFTSPARICPLLSQARHPLNPFLFLRLQQSRALAPPCSNNFQCLQPRADSTCLHVPLAAARPISTLSLCFPLPFHSHVPSHTLSLSL